MRKNPALQITTKHRPVFRASSERSMSPLSTLASTLLNELGDEVQNKLPDSLPTAYDPQLALPGRRAVRPATRFEEPKINKNAKQKHKVAVTNFENESTK